MAKRSKSRKYPASHRPAEFDSGTLRVLQALVAALFHGLFAVPPLPRPGEGASFLWIGDAFAGRDARPVDLRESRGCVTMDKCASTARGPHHRSVADPLPVGCVLVVEIGPGNVVCRVVEERLACPGAIAVAAIDEAITTLTSLFNSSTESAASGGAQQMLDAPGSR